jgi:hypothetical protein
VVWDDIWGARIIVESDLKEMQVAPSQGTHFFQNITASKIGYFTVNSYIQKGTINWKWLADQPAASEKKYTRHIHLENPLVVIMNGRKQSGIVIFPEENP